MLYPLSYEGWSEAFLFLHFNHLDQYMPEEVKPTEPEVDEIRRQRASADNNLPQGRAILGWLVLGSLIGVILAAAFLAYGQPELLLEQMNLRYCG